MPPGLRGFFVSVTFVAFVSSWRRGRNRRRVAPRTHLVSRPPAPPRRSRRSCAASCCSTASSTTTRSRPSGRRRRPIRASRWPTGAKRWPTTSRSGCNENLDKARAVARDGWRRADAGQPAVQAKAPTAREKGYLDAVERLFGDGDKASRDRAYADRMAPAPRAVSRRRRGVGVLRARAAVDDPAGRAQPAGLAEGRRDRARGPQEEPGASRREPLRAPRLRRWRACGAGAEGGAHLRAHRAGVEPRAPHAVARLPAARHVGRGGRVGRIGVRGVGRHRASARACRRRSTTSTRCRGCTTSTCSRDGSRRRARSMRTVEDAIAGAARCAGQGRCAGASRDPAASGPANPITSTRAKSARATARRR